MPRPFTAFRFTPHALRQMRRRQLGEQLIARILSEAGEGSEVRPGRIVIQARLPPAPGDKVYLVRVFVDVDRDPAEVVTAYRTSRILKYGSSEP